MKSPKHSRRQFLTTTAKQLAAMAALSTAGCKRPLAPKKPLNVILVTMDTTGARHLGCYGYQRPTSPNLDAFAQQSVLLENMYASSNCTFPNHNSIFTGLYPHNHGTIHQNSPKPTKHPLSAILSAQGYQTAAATSVSFLNHRTIGAGLHQFFSPQGAIERHAGITLDIARGYIDQALKAQQPFYLWVHLWDPHKPYLPLPQFADRFVTNPSILETVKRDFPSMFSTPDTRKTLGSRLYFTEEEQQAVLAQYDAEILQMDHHIGQFNAFLKSKRLLDNTIVVYTADHGESMFENAPSHDQHHFVYDPVTHVPFMMRHPDLDPKRLPGLVQNIDIAPTLLAALGHTLDPFTFDGANLLSPSGALAHTRDHVLMTEDGAREFGLRTSQGYTARACLLPRNGAKPAPEEWNQQAQTLPRIQIASASTGNIPYETANGAIPSITWNRLENDAAIARYALESLRDDGTQFRTPAMHITLNERTATCAFKRVSRRRWNSRAACGATPMRIIAVDASENVIAASTPIHVRLQPGPAKGELYDTRQDPDETTNIINKEPLLFATFEAQLTHFAQHSRPLVDIGDASPPTTTPDIDEQDNEALGAVGYL